MLEVKDSDNTAQENAAENMPETTDTALEVPRKVPAWAILLAVVSFIIFNALFLVFAMQMGSSNPG